MVADRVEGFPRQLKDIRENVDMKYAGLSGGIVLEQPCDWLLLSCTTLYKVRINA